MKKHIDSGQPLLVPILKYIDLDSKPGPEFNYTNDYTEILKYNNAAGHALTIVGYSQDENFIAIRDPSITNEYVMKINKLYFQNYDYLISKEKLFAISHSSRELLPFNTKKDATLVATKPKQLIVFKDINNAIRPHRTAITLLKEKGLIRGYGDGRYGNDDVLTRAQFTKIVLLAKYSQDEIDNAEKQGFPDVISGEWYENFVNFAKEKNIIVGYEDGKFRPKKEVNFAEASKIVLKTLAPNKILQGAYRKDEWFIPFTSPMKNDFGIDINPHKNITRAEMAYIVAKVKGWIK